MEYLIDSEIRDNIVLKKRLHHVNPIGAGGINVQSHVMDTASLVRLTEGQCSAIAKSKLLISNGQ